MVSGFQLTASHPQEGDSAVHNGKILQPKQHEKIEEIAGELQHSSILHSKNYMTWIDYTQIIVSPILLCGINQSKQIMYM